jgi:hypothetical protein
MHPQWSRRGFLAMAGATGLLVAGARAGGMVASAAPNTGGVTVTHAFGTTFVPAPPKRVVSAGFTEQDDLLALGVVPIATTEWFGDEPYAAWPWGAVQARRSATNRAQSEERNRGRPDRGAGARPDCRPCWPKRWPSYAVRRRHTSTLYAPPPTNTRRKKAKQNSTEPSPSFCSGSRPWG